MFQNSAAFYIKFEKNYFRMGLEKIKRTCDNIDKLYIRKIVLQYLGEDNEYSGIGFITLEGIEAKEITIEALEELAILEIDEDYKTLIDKQVLIQNRQGWEITVANGDIFFRRRLAAGIFEHLLISDKGELVKCKI